jgi:CPA2 family monovalent cation:H+ antiporter-2
MSDATSLNVGLTLLGRGEFSIIVAKLAQSGGLAALIQPFAALYVLILATFAPLLAKESETTGCVLKYAFPLSSQDANLQVQASVLSAQLLSGYFSLNMAGNSPRIV